MMNAKQQMRELRAKLRKVGLSNGQLSELTGISPSAVRQIRVNPRRFPRIDTYATMSNTLDRILSRQT